MDMDMEQDLRQDEVKSVTVNPPSLLSKVNDPPVDWEALCVGTACTLPLRLSWTRRMHTSKYLSFLSPYFRKCMNHSAVSHRLSSRPLGSPVIWQRARGPVSLDEAAGKGKDEGKDCMMTCIFRERKEGKRESSLPRNWDRPLYSASSPHNYG